jgi:hypothetical protein
MLRIIFGPRRDEVMGRRKLPKKVFIRLRSLPSITGIVMPRKAKKTEHAAEIKRKEMQRDYWRESKKMIRH